MKNYVYTFFSALLLASFFSLTAFDSKPTSVTPACGTYDVQLITASQEYSGNFDWVWTVSNPNPGNGLNCTIQNLSHWSLVLPADITQGNIISVSYSVDGFSWINLPGIIGLDPSQDCYAGAVLKFDQGTTGSAPTYYKLTVDQHIETGFITATFKSGNRTGCATYEDLVQGPGTPSGTTSR